jgi:thiamine biosynthesis protein ThiS
MNKTHLFFLNGQKYIAPSTLTISDLIDYFGYNQSLLVIEYNQFICNKDEWNKIFIQSNDKIEFVTIVGGG